MNEQYFQAVYQIITMGHWVTDQISKELKEFGMTEPQFNVLRVLRSAKGEPLTVQEILNNMVQRSSNVTRIIDKLLKKGYVNRQECATNRRKMDITITEAGREILEKLDAKVYDFHRPRMDKLTEEELVTLKALIQKLKQ